MATINTHGLKMDGLKESAAETSNYRWCVGLKTIISYLVDEGVVTANTVTTDAWLRWDDDANVVSIESTRHMSAQKVADELYAAVRLAESGMDWY
jgi:hypothetical protein